MRFLKVLSHKCPGNRGRAKGQSPAGPVVFHQLWWGPRGPEVASLVWGDPWLFRVHADSSCFSKACKFQFIVLPHFPFRGTARGTWQPMKQNPTQATRAFWFLRGPSQPDSLPSPSLSSYSLTVSASSPFSCSSLTFWFHGCSKEIFEKELVIPTTGGVKELAGVFPTQILILALCKGDPEVWRMNSGVDNRSRRVHWTNP